MDVVCVAVLSIVLSVAAYRFGLLTKDGSLAAVATGFVIGLFGSAMWLILLIVFAAIGFVATLTGFSKKREKGLQEGTHGERTSKNVIGVALPCIIFALINVITLNEHYNLMTVGYIATIAVAAADTAASEIGTRDPNAYLITTMKKVAPGTNGGISVTGTVVCIAASVFVTLVGWTVIFGFNYNILIVMPMIAGVIGCMLDSLFGATFETKGQMSKYANNCSTGIIGGLIAVLLTLLI